MPRRFVQDKVWNSIVTCSKCDREKKVFHYAYTKRDAKKDWPSLSWNGWDVSKPGKELCPCCAHPELCETEIKN